jgi:hypothetical protein
MCYSLHGELQADVHQASLQLDTSLPMGLCLLIQPWGSMGLDWSCSLLCSQHADWAFEQADWPCLIAGDGI